jgi:hypothetical protein
MLVGRVEWGARAPRSVNALKTDLVKGVVIHHSETSCCGIDTAEFENTSAALRSIQNFHMDTRGWADIAYNLAVDARGVIYGLRGIGNRSAANGTSATNDAYVAVMALGSYGNVEPSAALVSGLATAVKTVRAKYPKALELRGHRDVRSTDCPGSKLYAKLPTVNAIASAAPVSSHPMLRRSASGPWVTRLQSTLNNAGATDNRGLALGPDGEFGQRTEEALIKFNTVLMGFWKVPATEIVLTSTTATTWRFLDWFWFLKHGTMP